MPCPNNKPKDADDSNIFVRSFRAISRCEPLMHALILTGATVWWTWRDSSNAASLAAVEAQDAKRAAVSAKYEARDAKDATERVERSIERQMARIQDTLDRLTAHLMQKGDM